MKKTVLVVEDNERNRKLLRTILRHRGFEVVECDDGEPALELAARHAPSLILMDIELPKVSGIEALRRLRADARTAAIPVVAVTASVTSSERERVVAAGFSGYISKPIDVEAFGAMIDRLVNAESTR